MLFIGKNQMEDQEWSLIDLSTHPVMPFFSCISGKESYTSEKEPGTSMNEGRDKWQRCPTVCVRVCVRVYVCIALNFFSFLGGKYPIKSLD